MSGRRFGLLVALVAMVVGVGSFAGGVALLDDDVPDEPPGADTTDPGDGTVSSTTTAPGEPGTLETPAWVAVVSSEGDEARARAVAARVADAGFSSGVVRSDDHESLNPGFWVAYAGPYPDPATAEAAVADLAAAGIDGAYARCVGTAGECQPADGGGGEGDDGGLAGDDGSGRGGEDDGEDD